LFSLFGWSTYSVSESGHGLGTFARLPMSFTGSPEGKHIPWAFIFWSFLSFLFLLRGKTMNSFGISFMLHVCTYLPATTDLVSDKEKDTS